MRVLSNGVLHIIHDKGVEIEVSDVKEMKETFEQLVSPKPSKAIQEFKFGVSMNMEARTYAAEHSPALLGVAYIIDGLAQRLILRFYVRMWKRDKPTDFFSDVDEAMEWLESIG